MSKHTPGTVDVQNKGTLGCRSARHEIVAGVNVDGSKNLPCIAKMPGLSEESYANAAHIVKCWNSHDALLAALKNCLAVMEEMGPPLATDATAREARAAIKEARA